MSAIMNEFDEPLEQVEDYPDVGVNINFNNLEKMCDKYE